jgi:hypothetical protein
LLANPQLARHSYPAIHLPCCLFRLPYSRNSTLFSSYLAHLIAKGKRSLYHPDEISPAQWTVGNVITMNDRTADGVSQKSSLRDRRYAIRYPFAADAVVLDLESGSRSEGITSDISLGGCFVCTSKPVAVRTRARVTLTRKGESVEALATVRIVKPRIGMGLEFIDVEPSSNAILTRWLDQLRRGR